MVPGGARGETRFRCHDAVSECRTVGARGWSASAFGTLRTCRHTGPRCTPSPSRISRGSRLGRLSLQRTGHGRHALSAERALAGFGHSAPWCRGQWASVGLVSAVVIGSGPRPTRGDPLGPLGLPVCAPTRNSGSLARMVLRGPCVEPGCPDRRQHSQQLGTARRDGRPRSLRKPVSVITRAVTRGRR